MIKLKLLSILIVLFGILSGCSEREESVTWNVSESFTQENLTLYGTKGKFGIIKVNGEANEPEFPVGQGRHYAVYFFDKSKEINGKKYKLSAIHKDSKEAIQLYEWDIENNKSGAKFFLDKEGLWKLNVSIDDEPYTSFIIEAVKK
ncbi:hypothetical protein IHV09_19195 [Fictibacillus sp. 23RED33]|uniref:hypothetical protein n=1 Tax=Fictibacillus sp. 23RED33 TaxID=2745879 RepID=UPI0018CE785B|nr:hypothetical protein [Fictibacillus sp. 23RED33]MBH0175702.1 hypothetical protein [Fictibacillus sp. 23RED33]